MTGRIAITDRRILRVRDGKVLFSWKDNIRKANECLQAEEALREEQGLKDGQRPWEKHNPVWDEILQKILNCKKNNCPVCKQGIMLFAGLIKERSGFVDF